MRDHVARASEVSETLAKRFGYDPAKAKAATMVHDFARSLSAQELLALAQRFSLRLDLVEKEAPILIHGPVGAEILRRDYGLTDREILDAVACHTTGKRAMGLLDKILFLADKIEPEKVFYRPELEEVQKLAERSLDAAILKFFDLQIVDLISKGLPIHLTMIEARNEFLETRGSSRPS